jgi:hypothetical protein
VLAGVVLVSRSARPWLIGAALAAGALIKIAALLPLAGVVAWLAWRRGWRAAAKVSAWSGGFIVGAYLLAGGWRAVAPLDRASGYESRVSIWRGHLLRHVLGRPGWWAITVVVVVALVVIAGRLADLDPATAAGGAALVYLLAAPYVLPWYAGWALPVLALAWPRRLTVLALVDAAILLVIYVDRGGLAPASLHQSLQVMAGWVVPALELAALAGLAVVSVHRASALVARRSAAGRSAAAR